jgi:PIN domain nuclease of toxin-antitoxin system
VRLLLDTRVLLWASGRPGMLSKTARRLLDDTDNELHFSAASLWEIEIKRGLGRNGFQVDPRLLRHGLLHNGYQELTVSGAHAVAVNLLPPIHTDPFDRMLIAQAMVEAITLVTADPTMARYPGPVHVV